MRIPDNFDYGNIKDNKRLIGWLNEIVKNIEVDGYVTINKIHKFKDIDMVILFIRGKDPLLSSLLKYTVDAKILTPLYEIIKGYVSCNFYISDNKLNIPDTVCVEQFNFTAPKDETNNSNTYSLPQSPLGVLWRFANNGYYIIVDGCAPVPMHKIYFGYDNFSVNLDYIDRDGKLSTLNIMNLDDISYKYNKFNIIDCSISSVKNNDLLFEACDSITVCDDLGRKREAKVVDLKQYEKYMLNQNKFNKLYEKNYTLTVLTRMYKIASYLDGIGFVLNEMGFPCQQYSIPHRQKQTFTVNTNKQHNTFSIQLVGYDSELRKEVKTIYLMHKDLVAEYLKTKNEDIRNELQEIFKLQCSNKYGQLLHYFVNGLLDAIAIQKGDKIIRTEILKGYYQTVHKEFLMYGCYYYDIRTSFLRNNYRIGKEFNSVFVCNEYNGEYFLVG